MLACKKSYLKTLIRFLWLFAVVNCSDSKFKVLIAITGCESNYCIQSSFYQHSTISMSDCIQHSTLLMSDCLQHRTLQMSWLFSVPQWQGRHDSQPECLTWCHQFVRGRWTVQEEKPVTTVWRSVWNTLFTRNWRLLQERSISVERRMYMFRIYGKGIASRNVYNKILLTSWNLESSHLHWPLSSVLEQCQNQSWIWKEVLLS